MPHYPLFSNALSALFPLMSPAMESLLSAIASDLLSRALSMVIQRYSRSKAEETEHKLLRLQRFLLRIEATVEEAEGRHITSEAMLRKLEMLRQGMYGGHYMLDTIRYRSHGSDDEVRGTRTVALRALSSAKHLLFSPASRYTDNRHEETFLDAESVKKLNKMLENLAMMISDMEEFSMFLEGYPRICQQPYSTYLVLDKVMFGRQMEKETIINFLLQPEAASDGNPGVLPIVGLARVGKSTLVEHVCLDERVHGYFSSIVFFTGADLGAGKLHALRGSGVIEHQVRPTASHGKSLVVIELDGDMEGETWRRLYSSAASVMEHGSKIIVTSRSEKITCFGTAQALRLKLLPQEAYWYFKMIAFGSANQYDQPKLASLCMEVAAIMGGSFLGAHVVGGLMRANLNAQFWRKLLQCMRDFKSKHLLMFGEHPVHLMQKGQPVHIWKMARTQNHVTIFKIYKKRTPLHVVPKLTLQECSYRMCCRSEKVPHGSVDIDHTSLLHLLGQLCVPDGQKLKGQQEAPLACEGLN